jgi:hypothetical protein
VADLFQKCESFFSDPAFARELGYPMSPREAKEQGIYPFFIPLDQTEGTEVTVGGIDTGELSSRTMEAKKIPGLFAIGEAVDVTGWLGGYNFQWAWSSGWVAGEAV